MSANSAPDLSILIANWNAAPLLQNLLQSIDQTRGSLAVETIVVDNASTDGSADRVQSEFPAVRLIRNEKNLGFARANNQAAKIATSPILLLMNNDTVVHPGALEKLVRFLNQRPEVVAVGPKMVDANGNVLRSSRNLPTLAALLNSILIVKWTRICRKPYRQYRAVNCDMEQGGPVAQVDAASMAIRRTAFEECGGFDEEFEFGVEDVDLCARLNASSTIHYLPEASVEHVGRISSRANRTMVNRAYLCGWARYLRKHHGRAAAIVYKVLVTIDLPILVCTICLQYLGEKIVGKVENARLNLDRLRAHFAFAATGLVRFWMS